MSAQSLGRGDNQDGPLDPFRETPPALVHGRDADALYRLADAISKSNSGRPTQLSDPSDGAGISVVREGGRRLFWRRPSGYMLEFVPFVQNDDELAGLTGALGGQETVNSYELYVTAAKRGICAVARVRAMVRYPDYRNGRVRMAQIEDPELSAARAPIAVRIALARLSGGVLVGKDTANLVDSMEDHSSVRGKEATALQPVIASTTRIVGANFSTDISFRPDKQLEGSRKIDLITLTRTNGRGGQRILATIDFAPVDGGTAASVEVRCKLKSTKVERVSYWLDGGETMWRPTRAERDRIRDAVLVQLSGGLHPVEF